MASMLEIAEEAFPKAVLDEIYQIYDRRTGGYDTVDYDAVQRLLDRFPEKTEMEKDALNHYGAFLTR